MKNFAKKIAKEAGKILLKNLDAEKEVSYKKSGIYADYAQNTSNIDIEIENRIIELIHRKYPDHNILSEEVGEIKRKSNYTWILDPLDGTTQYIRGLPYFSTSVALSYQNEVISGVVYNPLLNELFYAEKGKGAFLNDNPIKVSETSNVKHALVCSSSYGSYKLASEEKVLLKILSSIKNVRIYGSPALDLCYIAKGRLDARITSYTEPWDHSAGCLIVEEAGGKVTDWKNNPWNIQSKNLIATNELIHTNIFGIIHHE